MKLTVGMIVKNEEKYLERCLESIRPILDSVDSELIITDTGSTDRTVEIAKKYTDNVLHFDWINDFAAARNSNLEKACGEWYMSVDGDDIWEDCSDIIYFFNSGEYKQYHSASYIYRSFFDAEKTTFSDQNVVRLAECSSELKYVGRIHENLYPLKKPLRMLRDIVDHYGYLYSDDNNAAEKARRNESLLLEELASMTDSDKRTPFIYYYLFEALRNVDPQKAYDYLDLGIKIASETRNENIVSLLVDKVGVLFPKEKYDELLGLCDMYFSLDLRDKHYTADVEMYAARALCFANTDRYDDACSAFEKFFSAYEKMKLSGTDDDDRFVITPVLSGNANFMNVVKKYIACRIQTDSLDALLERLEKTDLSAYPSDNDSIAFIVENEIALMSRMGYDHALALYNNLGDYGRLVFKNALCSVLFVDSNKAGIISALDRISENDESLREKLMIYRAFFIDRAVSEDEVCAYAKKYGTEGNHELLHIMMQCGMDISRLFSKSDNDPMICVKRCCDHIYGFYDAAAGYDAVYISSPEGLKTAAKIFEYCMKCAISISRDIEPLIFVYTGIGRKYTEIAGNDDLPCEIKAACIMAEAQALRKQGRYKECFSAMKDALSTYSGITVVVEEYQKTVLKEYEESANSMSEMDRLALQIKRNIRSFIDSGNIAAAKKTIDGYSKINPSDPEIIELLELIK